MNHNKFEKRFAHNNSQTYCTRNKGYIVFDHLNPYFKLQLFKHENNSSQQLALTLFKTTEGEVNHELPLASSPLSPRGNDHHSDTKSPNPCLFSSGKSMWEDPRDGGSAILASDGTRAYQAKQPTSSSRVARA